MSVAYDLDSAQHGPVGTNGLEKGAQSGSA